MIPPRCEYSQIEIPKFYAMVSRFQLSSPSRTQSIIHLRPYILQGYQEKFHYFPFLMPIATFI